MSKKQNEPNSSTENLARAKKALEGAIGVSQIAVPSTLRDTMREYDRISRSLAQHVTAIEAANAAVALDSAIAEKIALVNKTSIEANATQMISRHEQALLEAIERAHSQALGIDQAFSGLVSHFLC